MSLNQLNWFWIGLELTITPLAAALVAYPLWRKGQSVLGSIAGTVVIFATALGLILREYVEIDHIVKACLDAGTTCFPEPSAFTRFAIYAFIALGEVFLLFSVSLKWEEWRRRQDYAPEWRR